MSTTTIPTPSVFGTYEPTLLPVGPILVATDLSADADAAFPLAERLAERTSAAVQVISVLRPLALPMYGFDSVPVPLETDTLAREGRQAAIRAQMGRMVAANADWDISVVTGEPTHEIAERARAQKSRLIVVGRGRHSTFERVVGGDSVLRMLQLGDTPVLAVEKGLTHLPKRVVVATDFSEFSLYAARVAMRLVAPDAIVHLVNVRPRIDQTDTVRRELDTAYQQRANSLLEQMTVMLASEGVQFNSTLLVGDTAEQLRSFLSASQADLVVLATHGFGFVRRLVLGSLASAMVHTAPCSVLCVPGSARTNAAARARGAASATTRQLAPITFDAELAAFTIRNTGRRCTVEVDQPDLGAQQLGHELPLIGATFDRTSGAASFMFGASGLAGPHLTHNVAAVTSIDISGDANGHDRALRLVHGGGQTLLLLD
jgi:nucleotide-binding universal stress UspA family protein